MPHSLLFFPDYRRDNPYQELMYRHTAPELHARAGTIEEALALRPQQPASSGMVFHLHWEDAVYRHEPDETAARDAATVFLDRVEQFLDGGGQLVWTIHNAGPHEERYPDVHRELSRGLAHLADLVHLHSPAGVAWAIDHLGIEPARIVLVPHGNYRPLFLPLGAPRAEVRAALGLPVEADLLLLFGRLEPYKGAEELIQALAPGGERPLHLLIAGRQIQPLAPMLDGLDPALRARVHLREGFVPAEEVPVIFHAADAVVMPYRAILSSGTGVLAMSLARPVIAPAHPGITDLVRDGIEGVLYDPHRQGALADAIGRFQALPAERRRAMEKAAEDRARLSDWAISGNLLGGALHRLLALRPPTRRLPPPITSPMVTAQG